MLWMNGAGVTPWNPGIRSTHPTADDGQTGERADDGGGTSHQQGATWPSQEAWDAPAATWRDHGIMGWWMRPLLTFKKASFQWPCCYAGAGFRVKRCMIFHGISILKSWFHWVGLTFPILESKVGAEQTQAGFADVARLFFEKGWCIERLISLALDSHS